MGWQLLEFRTTKRWYWSQFSFNYFEAGHLVQPHNILWISLGKKRSKTICITTDSIIVKHLANRAYVLITYLQLFLFWRAEQSYVGKSIMRNNLNHHFRIMLHYSVNNPSCCSINVFLKLFNFKRRIHALPISESVSKNKRNKVLNDKVRHHRQIVIRHSIRLRRRIR